MFKPFYSEIKNQFNFSIKILRFDNAKEDLDNHFSQFWNKMKSYINPHIFTLHSIMG